MHITSKRVILKDGTDVFIRPYAKLDRTCFLKGFQELSDRSRYFRFFSQQRFLSEDQIRTFTEIDQMNHLALCAMDISDKKKRGIGIARYICTKENPDLAECTITVIDAYQRKGLGTVLLGLLIQYARENSIQQLFGYVLPENEKMLRLVRRFGGSIHLEPGLLFRIELDLKVEEAIALSS